VATTPTSTDRWKVLDFGPPPSDLAEPDQPVLVEYVAGERVALITLNRPHADNAITTEMGARLTEILETIAVRPTIRVVVITGAGDRAFSVGSDLRQRKSMTKEDWLRQRQAFDRTLYTVRQLRKPLFAAVNGIAYGGGSELAQNRLHHRLRERDLHTRMMIGSRPRPRPSAAPVRRGGAADADDGRSDSAQEATGWEDLRCLPEQGRRAIAASRAIRQCSP
jgi:hypothetical protein